MELRTFFLIAIAALGFLSALLSFIAEGKKLAESDIRRLASDECAHSRGPALGLGLAAAIALLIAQIISNSLGGCICCESGANDPSGKSTPIAIAISCLTLSWVTFSIAFLLLVAGASINDKRDASDDSLSTGCYVLKSGVFTGAAFASMATAICGIAYNLQVFTIRKNMAVAVSGPVDGGLSSPDMQLNNNIARHGTVNAQNYMAARPIFWSDQRQEAKGLLDPNRAVYPRRAVSPHADMKFIEMVSPQYEKAQAPNEHMRRTLTNTEISYGRRSKQMRGSLALQQQGHSGPDSSMGEDNYGSLKASQSASASYHSIDPSGGAQFEYEQETTQPVYIRSGGANT